MALRTLVKISGVNNLSDARYCAGMGVEMLGFCFEEGRSSFVSPEKYQEIIAWISGVSFVGEFEEYSLEQMNEVLEAYPVHILQIAREDVLQEIQRRSREAAITSLQVIVRIDFASHSPEYWQRFMEKYADTVRYFLLEGAETSLSDTQIEAIKLLSAQFPILLGFGINSQNVDTLLSESALRGIALQGGEEIRPGYKDFDALAEVLEAIETD